MQLPIDIKGLVDEMTDISAARNTPLTVSVYIDEAAQAELVAHVRNAFASSLPSVRMTVSYLDSSFRANPKDDIAVFVASDSQLTGICAAGARAVGVPSMIVTMRPNATSLAAAKAGFTIPKGDIVAPIEGPGFGSSFDSVAKSGLSAASGFAITASEAGVKVPPQLKSLLNKSRVFESQPERFDVEEPIALNETTTQILNERMGHWIVSVCREKRLAFAIAFPFMRRPLASDAVFSTAIQNAGVGLVPFLPGADLPIMTLNQAKMALQIAAAYGHEMGKDRLKELGGVLVGAYLSRALVRRLIAAVPVLGFVFRTGVAYGSTMAVGHAIIEYFEGGKDVTGVANVVERATATGTKVASTLHDKTSLFTQR